MFRGCKIAAVEHEVAVVRHMIVEHGHLVRFRDFCTAEVESLVIAVSQDMHGIIFRVGMGVQIILNLAHGVLTRIDFKHFIAIAELGKNRLFLRDIAVDDDKLISVLCDIGGKRGIKLFCFDRINRDVFVDFRMDDGVMERIVGIIRRNLKIKRGVQDKFPVFRKMALKNIRIKVGVPDDFDGIVFRIAGLKEGIDLFCGVGIIVKHKDFSIFRQEITVEIPGGFRIKNQEFVRVGGVGIRRSGGVSGVWLFAEVGVEEVGNGCGKSVVRVCHA